MTRTTDEKTTPPMILPPGGYELEDIEKAGAAAMKAKPEDRDRVLTEEIEKVRKADYEASAGTILPGHKVVERERVIQEGVEQPKPGGKAGETETVGEVVVRESIQVFDKKKAKEDEKATEEATVAGEGATTGTAAAGAADTKG